ncbi:MAG: fibronectin type III domain-containing protein [Ilumatobacteraceae bacterium]
MNSLWNHWNKRAPLSDSDVSAPDRRRRPTYVALAGIAAALLVGVPSVLVGGASVAGAAVSPVPTFPDNLLVFPNRDFVSIAGYSEHVGEIATIEVTRPGVGVVGSAQGEVSGTDVAFEINHPGGVCWGAGTGLKVTPDILSGDVVSISFGGAIVGATTVLDVYANDAIQNGTTVLVPGHIGSTMDPANMEQRIVEAALVDTAVGKRDVRAVPGPLTPAPQGGYSSSLEFDAATQSFLATYVFDDEATAHIAANAGLGERALAWEVVDPAGNRQGITIAENGEPGGPGVGGCPNGPRQSGPPGPASVVAAKAPNGTSIQVNWTPATAIPGTGAIDGYQVTAVAQTTSANNEQVEIGKRITNGAATSTTITGLVAGETYDIEVVSHSTVGYTFPPVVAVPVVDVTPPVVTASPAGGSYPVAQLVTLTANELGSDIYYTTDSSNPISGDQLNGEPLHYTGPITIDAGTTLRFAAFDAANNVSDTVTEEYMITNDPVPAATTFTTSSVGAGTVTLNWAPADAGAPGLTITAYQIDLFDSAAATTPLVGQGVTTAGDVTTATISGLTGDTPYWFTVRAQNNANTAFGPASALLGPLTPQGDVVANAGPDQINVVRNTKVTLSGIGSTAIGATFTWTQLVTGTSNPMPAGVDKVTLAPVALTPQNASFTLPFFKYPMVNSALTFQLAVTVGGVTKTDLVLITPRSEVVTITSARWKINDFRVIGTSTTVGGIVTVRSATGTIYGAAAVTAAAPPAVGGVYDVRIRVSATRPAPIFVESNLGGTVGPFTTT